MLLGELAALANAVIWAGMSVVLGRLGGRLSAVRVNAFQLCFAGVSYLLLIPFAGGARLFTGLTPLRFLGLLATAVLTMGMGDSLYFTSISRIGASRASPISVSAFPLITILLGALLLGEQLTLPVAGGSMLIVGGIALLVSESRPKTAASAVAEAAPPIAGGSGDGAEITAQATEGLVPEARTATDRRTLLLGVAFVLAAAVCWSAATLGLRVASAGLPAAGVTAIRVPTAAIFLLTVLRSRGRLNTRGIGRRDWLLIGAAGLIGTGLGSLTYIIAIQGTGAGLTALLTSTSPLWVLPLAAVFLHERLTRRVFLGAALALGGIWLVLI